MRLYPREWRARYGEELEALIVESSDGRRVPWQVRADVALAGGRERLRAAGLGEDIAPGDQVRGGALLVLCAWALFVVAGIGVQKLSEHWQATTPDGSQALPSVAFGGLVVGAICASVLVLVGLASTFPSLVALLRGGGWPVIRRPVVTAVLLTVVMIAATVVLVVWAHGLNGRQRAGDDTAYAIAFVTWGLLAVVCLFVWTVAAVTTARRLRLPVATLRLEAKLATAVTVVMAVMTAATAVWWAALADAAPWFLAGRPVGSSASPLAPEPVAAAALMVLATLLGAAGARQALRALPALAAR